MIINFLIIIQVEMNNISKIGMQCVGCRSCEQRCPKNCITMEENKEGFIYPVINYNKCIDCGVCLQGCPVKKSVLHRNKPDEVWAWKNKNEVDIMRSASGGAADSATKVILEMGGVVYGAAYDDQLVVTHIPVDNEENRHKLQSSKYVQSDLKDTYNLVQKNLSEGRVVLYTGTPCQISGLYAFLGGDRENLYTLDLICHGVPSPEFFKKYIKYKSKRIGGKIVSFNFRSKDKRGWGTQYWLKTKTKTKTETKVLVLDCYGKHFMDGDCLRECCYQCDYANTDRVADLTVGDFWGIAKSHPDFNSPKGVSSVFVNTKKGKLLFEQMKIYAEFERVTLKEAVVKQGNLIRPSNRPKAREYFYNGINEENFIENITVGFQMKERIKSILPNYIIRIIKQF